MIYYLIMKQTSYPVYAFIDSQNLNLGTLDFGWKLDFAKFRLYLRNKYNVQKAYLFIGYIEKNREVTYKGNVDAELVLHTMIQKDNFQKAIIVSGDGDFYCLIEYLFKEGLLANIMTPNSKYSSLLKEFGGHIVDITKLRGKLEYKGRHSRGKQG